MVPARTPTTAMIKDAIRFDFFSAAKSNSIDKLFFFFILAFKYLLVKANLKKKVCLLKIEKGNFAQAVYRMSNWS